MEQQLKEILTDREQTENRFRTLNEQYVIQ